MNQRRPRRLRRHLRFRGSVRRCGEAWDGRL